MYTLAFVPVCKAIVVPIEIQSLRAKESHVTLEKKRCLSLLYHVIHLSQQYRNSLALVFDLNPSLTEGTCVTTREIEFRSSIMKLTC